MLKKVPPVTVIPSVPAVPERMPYVVCGEPSPTVYDRYYAPSLPPAADPTPGSGYYVYVPSNTQYYVSETVVFSPTYPTGDYTCAGGQYLVADPTFPGGSKIAYETRCYWNYV